MPRKPLQLTIEEAAEKYIKFRGRINKMRKDKRQEKKDNAKKKFLEEFKTKYG